MAIIDEELTSLKVNWVMVGAIMSNGGSKNILTFSNQKNKKCNILKTILLHSKCFSLV